MTISEKFRTHKNKYIHSTSRHDLIDAVVMLLALLFVCDKKKINIDKDEYSLIENDVNDRIKKIKNDKSVIDELNKKSVIELNSALKNPEKTYEQLRPRIDKVKPAKEKNIFAEESKKAFDRSEKLQMYKACVLSGISYIKMLKNKELRNKDALIRNDEDEYDKLKAAMEKYIALGEKTIDARNKGFRIAVLNALKELEDAAKNMKNKKLKDIDSKEAKKLAKQVEDFAKQAAEVLEKYKIEEARINAENELKKQEAEAQQKEAEAQQKEAEEKQKEAEAQQKEAEEKQKEAEEKQKELDLKEELEKVPQEGQCPKEKDKNAFFEAAKSALANALALTLASLMLDKCLESMREQTYYHNNEEYTEISK
ncbi:MAG: hypothetical protein IKH75_18885, partial [Ruminococcus sp.]|nr:hypothetical protein [Ruminococcus sp.]